ncbi:hypothetical protein AXG93_107s1090 [Marchantia polymorpha subsp. ruderalis]|uniref:Uncharacterized protein n=1 Tax=Marchantia polymorpha subsp. ruderalis TaxID=1480154 RepID=A0A176WKF1_MARPO|nr:hypothetical protein AXG93_107s1090 [Marchantia polymorpha subsp. ruderalis]
MGAEAENVDFRSLFEEKEKELVGICERQIEFFHQQVLERDRHIKDLSAKFSQLKEDFKYNLELLDERDAELTHYEAELAALQISIKAARDEHEETQDRLTEAESQRLEEKRRSEDKDKVHQQALATLRQQIESFQFSREQLMSMHKEAFETASAELMSEVEKRQADLDNHSKVLESQYHDKLRIHELQSQLALDAVENKLSQAERKVTQLESGTGEVPGEPSLAVSDIEALLFHLISSLRIQFDVCFLSRGKAGSYWEVTMREDSVRLARLNECARVRMDRHVDSIGPLRWQPTVERRPVARAAAPRWWTPCALSFAFSCLFTTGRGYENRETELDIEVQKRRGDANMRMSKELAELQAENDDVHSRADNADYQAQQVNKKLQVVETEHRKQTLQMRLQIENFQKRLETAESRLGEWDGKRPGEIQGYLEKASYKPYSSCKLVESQALYRNC